MLVLRVKILFQPAKQMQQTNIVTRDGDLSLSNGRHLNVLLVHDLEYNDNITRRMLTEFCE